MLLVPMAWRNVWRNRRRSLITIAAIAFAFFTVTLYSGLVRGYLRDLERNVVEYEVGDLQIHRPGYRHKPSLYDGVERSAEVVERLTARGFRASPRLLGGGLAAAGDASAGVSLRGIDVGRDAAVSKVATQVQQGRWLDPAHPDEVVIGKRLARVLGIDLAQRPDADLVILTQGADGSTANRIYKVRGVLRGVTDSTDRGGVFLTSEAFRELFVYQGDAHQILVRRPESLPLEAATAEAARIAGPGLEVLSWRGLAPTLASLLDAALGMTWILFVIVYIAIAVVILNAMLMAVFERVRELGLLKAIGMSPRAVMALVVLESAFQTGIAIVIGLLLALPGVFYLSRYGINQGALANASIAGVSRNPIWLADFNAATFVGPVVMLVVIVGLAVVYPGLKAARLNPVDAIQAQVGAIMRGPRLYAMAWRNLWRNRRRTLITLFALVFGFFMAFFFQGLTDQSLGDAIDMAARVGSGHVTLQHPAQIDTPSTKNTVLHARALADKARAIPGVRATTTRITGQLMLATAGQMQAAQVIAYDPAVETPETLPYLRAVPEADRLKGARDAGIVLGAGLSESLGAPLGRKVVYTLTDRRGEIVSGLARVTGLLKSGVDGIDNAVCLLPIDTLRAALGYGEDEATFVAVYLSDHRDSDKVARALQAAVGSDVAALAWHQVSPDLAAFIATKQGGLVVMGIIMLLLTGAGIFNTLFVSVMERLREFGVLMAIGFSPGRLFRLVIWESLWLGLVGVLAGAAITAWPYYHFATVGWDIAGVAGTKSVDVAGLALSSVMYTRIHLDHALWIVAMIVGATLGSGLYPAWRAGRVVPVESIKLV